MLKRLLIIFGLVLFSSYAWAQHSGNAPGTSVQEEDGSPDASCFVLKVGNGDLTDNGDGTCSITTGGGGTPGGSDGDIQFNDSSSFGGFGDWNGVQLSVTGSMNITGTQAISSDVSIGGTNATNSAFFFDESSGIAYVGETNGVVQFGDGTDRTQTLLRMDLASTDLTFGFNSSTDQVEINYPLVVTGTATIDNTGMQAIDNTTTVTTGSFGLLPVAADYNTWVVNDMLVRVNTPPGGTGEISVNLFRDRAGTAVPVFSTPVTLSAGEYFAVDGSINVANDDVLTGDAWIVSVGGTNTGTQATGLSAILTLWSE